MSVMTMLTCWGSVLLHKVPSADTCHGCCLLPSMEPMSCVQPGEGGARGPAHARCRVEEQGCASLLRTIQGVTERSTDAKADSINLQQVDCHHERTRLHLLTSVWGHIHETLRSWQTLQYLALILRYGRHQ